jgi:hypothetical protein
MSDGRESRHAQRGDRRRFTPPPVNSSYTNYRKTSRRSTAVAGHLRFLPASQAQCCPRELQTYLARPSVWNQSVEPAEVCDLLFGST